VDADVRQELERLTTAVRALDDRLTALEAGSQPLAAPVAEEEPDTAIDGDVGFSTVFAKLALICFSMVGALLLRVATQRGLVDASVGTAIGLGYCTLLVVGPILARRVPILAAHGVVLEYCGAVLVPLIVLEMFHRHAVFDAAGATFVLLAAGVTGCSLGALHRSRGLAAVALVISAAGIAGLGLDPAGAAVRAFALVVLVAAALTTAHLRSWAGVRAAALLPVLSVLGLAILMVARRDSIPPEVRSALVMAAISIWVLLVVNHLVRRARLEPGEAAWLVVVTIWCGALVRFALPGSTSVGAAVAVALLAGAFHLSRTTANDPTIVGAALSGAILAAVTLPGLDSSGVALGLVPLTLLATNHFRSRDLLTAAGAAIVVVAVASALPALLTLPATTSGILLTGLVLPAALLVHWAAPGAATRARELVAPVSLVGGWLLLFLAARAVAFGILGESDGFQLAVTLILGVFALLSQLLGRRFDSKPWLAAGVIGIVLLGIKSVFWDLIHVSGPYAAASVVALGVASGLTSWLLRRRRA